MFKLLTFELSKPSPNQLKSLLSVADSNGMSLQSVSPGAKCRLECRFYAACGIQVDSFLKRARMAGVNVAQKIDTKREPTV